MKHEAIYGDPLKKPSAMKRYFVTVTYLPAILIILFAVLLIRVADFLLLDTHHFELKATPKK